MTDIMRSEFFIENNQLTMSATMICMIHKNGTPGVASNEKVTLNSSLGPVLHVWKRLQN